MTAGRRAAALVVAVVAVGLISGCNTDHEDRDAMGTRVRTTYGDQPDQTMEIFRPAGDVQPGVPVVLLIHGGFWRQEFAADLMVPLAEDLAARGVTTVNIEYARVGRDGGWPRTLADVAAAVDALADPDVVGDVAEQVRARGVVSVGHSAGGHLAVWAASRGNIPTQTIDEVGGPPVVLPCAVVSQAGVVAFDEATRLGNNAVSDLLGGSREEVPERWDAADPSSLLPTGVVVALVHGEDDRIVPVSQSERYAELAVAAGDDARVVVVPGDHFVNLDVGSAAWAAVVDVVASTRC